MKINYHIHTSMSDDVRKRNGSGETPFRYAEAARKAGIAEICFTDHLVVGYSKTSPLYWNSVGVDNLEKYFLEIDSAARTNKETCIKKGIEVEWFPEKAGEIKRTIKRYPFDCVLGSVHILGNAFVEHDKNDMQSFWGKYCEKVYEKYIEYYDAVKQMAGSGICDVVAHLDLIKRDGYVPERNFLPLVKETLDIIAENNLCIEVNTAGMRKPIKEMHPSFEILNLCSKKGIPVTIGTDAHKVGQIDFHLDEGMDLIKKAGYEELAIFKKRKIAFIDL